MLGAKRFIRHGLVISALGHAGFLASGLLFLRASSHEAVPPDATLVEIVTPQDIPRFSGSPSVLRTSGSDAAARSQPAMRAQNVSPQSEQQQQKQQAQAQRDASAKPRQPPMRQAEAGEVAMPPPRPADPAAPSAADTQEPPDAAATMSRLAQLALLGGRLGGGFAAPPIDSPLAGFDFTLAFRERVSSCSPLPRGIDRSDKISINLRIFLNRDGTLTKAPQLLEQTLSAKQRVLFNSFVSGLEKCQPYTMLPADKYQQWKAFDVLVFPMESYGG